MSFGSGVLKTLSFGAVMLAATSLGPGASPAQARGFVAFGFGLPLVGPAYPPPPPIVYAPPPYYGPPMAYPPPGYVAPPSAPAAQQECREYQSTATVDGQPQQTVGTACLQPDGTWRIVK